MRCSILIFGEADTDTQALKHVVTAINAANKKPVKDIVIRALKKPIVLSRNADRKKLRNMSEVIAAIWRAEKSSRVEPVIIVHQDCDAIEPAHVPVAKATRSELSSLGVTRIVTATAAWEIETWWMLFPDALRATRACWASIDYGCMHVGSICNSKERLRNDLRPSGKAKGCPDYSERDSVSIASKLGEMRCDLSGTRAQSDSFRKFHNEMKSQLEDKVFY